MAFKTFSLQHFLSLKKRYTPEAPLSWLDTMKHDGVSRIDFDQAIRLWQHRHRPHTRTGPVPKKPRMPRHPYCDAGGPYCCRDPVTPSVYTPKRFPRRPRYYPAGETPPRDGLHYDTNPTDPPAAASASVPSADGHPDPPEDPAAILENRIRRMRAATLAKVRRQAAAHTSAWYHLSSNKEADERGSRASVSVEGLRRVNDPEATTHLASMLQIAREHFQDLHTPIRPTLLRHDAQRLLLADVKAAYSGIHAPDVPTGRFTLDEIVALKEHMPGTAPGPDGIPYQFYKSLARIVDDDNYPDKITRGMTSFWSAFCSLTDDLRAHGPD